MKARLVLPAALLAVSLAGCSGLSGLVGASNTQNLGIGQNLVNDSVAALQAEQDARTSASMVSQGVTTQSLTPSSTTSTTSTTATPAPSATPSPDPASASIAASGSVAPPASLDDGCECEDAATAARFSERAKALWQKEGGAIQNVQKSQQTNSDGSVTTTFQAQIQTKGLDRQIQVVKTVSASGSLMAMNVQIESQAKSGLKVHLTRTMTVNPDGTWTSTFTRTTENPNGKSVTISWTETGKPDGSDDAQGEMSRADGSKTAITITRDSTGATVLKDVDDQTGVSVEVDQADLSQTAVAKISSTASGKVIATDPISDTTTVTAADQ